MWVHNFPRLSLQLSHPKNLKCWQNGRQDSTLSLQCEGRSSSPTPKSVDRPLLNLDQTGDSLARNLLLITKGMTILDLAVGAVVRQTTFSLARIAIRDLVPDTKPYLGSVWLGAKPRYKELCWPQNAKTVLRMPCPRSPKSPGKSPGKSPNCSPSSSGNSPPKTWDGLFPRLFGGVSGSWGLCPTGDISRLLAFRAISTYPENKGSVRWAGRRMPGEDRKIFLASAGNLEDQMLLLLGRGSCACLVPGKRRQPRSRRTS